MTSPTIEDTTPDSDLTDVFECGICTDNLMVPKSLPCLHSFCHDCLAHYFQSNDIAASHVFLCPVCQAETVVPEGGAEKFPTNFLIENLRRSRSSLDFGFTMKDTMQFWENKEEDLVEQLAERKRQILISINERREEIVSMIDAYIEGMQERIEDRYIDDSCRTVQAIQGAKTKLAELQANIAPCNEDEDLWNRLKRQGETMSNIANEIEEIKSTTDIEISKVLSMKLSFEAGSLPAERLQYHFGSLVRRVSRTKHAERSIVGYLIHNGQLSVLTFLNWSQSWWMLLLGIIPALIIAVLLRVFYGYMEWE